jgi:hypothetical protein
VRVSAFERSLEVETRVGRIGLETKESWGSGPR